MRRRSIINRDGSPKPGPALEVTPPVESSEDSTLKLLYDGHKTLDGKKIFDKEPDENADSTEHIRYYMRMRDNGRQSRKSYLESLYGPPRKRVDNELIRIEKLRKSFFANPTKTELVRDHLKWRKLWRKEAMENQKRNLEDLARRRQNFKDEMKPLECRAEQLHSEETWFDKVFKKAEAQDSISDSENDEEDETLRIEKWNERLDMFKNEERILKAIPGWERDPDETPTKPTKESEMAKEKMNYNIKAGVMYFHGNQPPKRNEHVQGVFPDQKIPIETLLGNVRNNPILEPSSREDGPIRYFHLPTNNMVWVEKFLELYYSQASKVTERKRQAQKLLATKNWQGNDQESKDKTMKGPAERLLAFQNWKGQIHGGTEHPVHARHLRPRCLTIMRDSSAPAASPGGRYKGENPISRVDPSGDPPPAESAPKIQNFSIFMPYLHWEIKSRQIKMAEVITEISKGKKSSALVDLRNNSVKKRNKNEKRGAKEKEKSRAELDWTRLHYLARYKKETGQIPEDRTKHLGKYLMSVAKLAEAMDYEADERLLRDFLNHEPPLHVRRTLDQSYFWTLEDTASRDRDQVVYRGTRGRWRPQGRIVMVDQLWMWILDENTILTSFPRRWGRNKPDSSGVHKSLRDRLEQEEEISSVFDLALIIIDQCSRVFFDRTRPKDLRPEVMDIFGNAVASVTHKKTASYERFWAQLEQDSLTGEHHSKESARTYLNINPEGALLRECEDIVEELHMMGRIFTQQHQVVLDFKKYLDRMNASSKGSEETTGGATPQYPRVPKSTLLAAQELLDHILERRKEIFDLEDEAKRTNAQLHNLLGLKQQQASIIEARLALERADQSNQQGRSVMLFTIVTILFLPLSFFTSLFGMNNVDWEGHPMSLYEQFRYMLPVSFAVIILSLMVAFNDRTRDRFVKFFSAILDKLAKYPPFTIFFVTHKRRTIDRDYLKEKIFLRNVRKEVEKRSIKDGIGNVTGTLMGSLEIMKVETGDSNV